MKTMLALAALAGALCVAPAAAQIPAQDDRVQVVRTADLDLRSDRGRSTLDRRIRTAVQVACGTPSNFDLEGQNEARRCRAETMDRIAIQRDRAVAVAAGSAATVLAFDR